MISTKNGSETVTESKGDNAVRRAIDAAAIGITKPGATAEQKREGAASQTGLETAAADVPKGRTVDRPQPLPHIRKLLTEKIDRAAW